MNIKRLSGMALLCALSLCTSCRTTQSHSSSEQDTRPVTVQYQYYQDKAIWNHTFTLSDGFVVPSSFPRSIIIPHHDIALFQQNSFYKALSSLGQPSVVVVICPDHYEQGKSCITSAATDTVFDTPAGPLPLNNNIINSLCVAFEYDSKKISLSSTLWKKEHGVYSQTPFIKHYFPSTTIVPIALRPCSIERDAATYERLGAVLKEILPDDALVVASVDFSHYQTPKMTNLHDDVSRDTIANNESPYFIEVDSPESLASLFAYNKAVHAELPVLINRTSTFDFIPKENVLTTSHQYWAFYEDEAKTLIPAYYEAVAKTKQRAEHADYAHTANQTILIGGSGDTGAGIRTCWTWNRYNADQGQAEKLLRAAAGNEARFFSGFDALIFDPKPGTSFIQHKHGTTLTVTSIAEKDIASLSDIAQGNADGPSVNILVVTDSHATDEAIAPLLAEYDIIVTRDSKGAFPAHAYLRDSSGTPRQINLGTLYSATTKHITGTLLAVNWHDGIRHIETFDYTSETGVIPAINQFDVR